MAYIVNVPKLRLGEKEIFAAGDRIDLSSKLAAKLLKKAYIRFDQETKKIVNTLSVHADKLIPDGNVEKTLEFISGIDDVELLKRVTLEEENGKNRKSVLVAVEEKIQELIEEDNDPEADGEPGINFNPEEVIDNG